MPDAPTWDEVAEIARTIDTDEMAGICLRGKPSWGDLGAIFTTVVNTFGATYWLEGEDNTIGESQVDQPEFKEAVEFYVGLIEDAGEDDAANSSYNECTSQLQAGKAAMWVDATVAASNLEGDDSPIKGKLGYALSPTKVTDTSGWLWSWALAIPETAPDKDAAWEYVSWATGPQYLAEAGDLLPGGWAALPPGTRQSLYANPAYQEAAAAFADRTLAAMQAAPIDNPGVQPRPGLPGVQFVGVPQFQDFGTRCMQEISASIAGSQSTDDAIAACDAIATEFEGQRW
jgi:sorbitol/mannitol transport system substrate-binding protein